jgi:hypothetical protein
MGYEQLTPPNAVVERVASGKLVYVRMKHEPPGTSHPFKLDQLMILERSGLRPYRGEPLAELGIEHGSAVFVEQYADGSPRLVFDTTHRSLVTIISTTASNIINTVTGTIGLGRK